MSGFDLVALKAKLAAHKATSQALISKTRNLVGGEQPEAPTAPPAQQAAFDAAPPEVSKSTFALQVRTAALSSVFPADACSLPTLCCNPSLPPSLSFN